MKFKGLIHALEVEVLLFDVVAIALPKPRSFSALAFSFTTSSSLHTSPSNSCSNSSYGISLSSQSKCSVTSKFLFRLTFMGGISFGMSTVFISNSQ